MTSVPPLPTQVKVPSPLLPETAPSMVLYTHSRAWGLPTFSPQCLHVLTYAVMAGVEDDMEVVPCGNPSASPSGTLPFLRDGDVLVSGTSAIIDYLKRRGHNLDFKISPEEASDALAYTSLIEGDLAGIMMYNWWGESANAAVIRGLYAESLPFPLSWILPKQLETHVNASLATGLTSVDAVLASSDPDDIDADALYDKANTIYIALAARLGESPFFFGPTPSAVDAALFSHLLLQYLAPLPVCSLSSMIRTHPNLVAYISRIAKDYLGCDLMSSPSFVPPSPVRNRIAGSPSPSPKKRPAPGTPDPRSGPGHAADASDTDPAAAASDTDTAEPKAPQDPYMSSDEFRATTRLYVGIGVTAVVGYVLFYLGGGIIHTLGRSSSSRARGHH